MGEIIEFVFGGDLEINESSHQKSSSDNMHIIDYVFRVKRRDIDDFWEIIREKFNSSYVVFECKNYKEEYRQNIIYTTKKHLLV